MRLLTVPWSGKQLPCLLLLLPKIRAAPCGHCPVKGLQGMTTTSLLWVKSRSPSLPPQAKLLRTSSTADELSVVLLRQTAFPGAGGAEWDNHTPTEPLRPVPCR